MGMLKSFFDEQRVVERTPIIELKSLYGTSKLRDLTIGNVTSNGTEFVLASAGGADRVVLDTAERGPYAPGQELEPGLAPRIPARLTGTQVMRIGYFDDDNGWYYEYTAEGLFLCIRKEGASNGRQQWGEWTDDGTAIQRGGLITDRITPSDGNVHQIALTWYGFGPAEYSFQLPSRRAHGWMEKLGIIRPVGGTSTGNPHLPLRAEVITQAGDDPCTMYVSGRQVNMVGRYEPIFRPTSVDMSSATVSDAGWTTLGAVRRRSVTPYALTKLEAISVIASADIQLAVALDPTIPNPGNWSGEIADIPTTETLLEENTDPGAVDITTAAWLQKERIQASSGGGRTGGRPVELVRLPLIELQPFVILAKARTGSNVTVDLTAQFREDY